MISRYHKGSATLATLGFLLGFLSPCPVRPVSMEYILLTTVSCPTDLKDYKHLPYLAALGPAGLLQPLSMPPADPLFPGIRQRVSGNPLGSHLVLVV